MNRQPNMKRAACRTTVVAVVLTSSWIAMVQAQTPQPTPLSMSKYMNSVPPSNDYFCVGTGPTNLALHPDRAPHTKLAMQGNVVLFSGAAPQQGLNFQIPVGAMVYRNQMSTLGSPEPSPQVGTAGTLQQKPWENYLPWSEARWHPGEDITWQGYRADASYWLGGIPHWELPDGVGEVATQTIRPLVCGELVGPIDIVIDEVLQTLANDIHAPTVTTALNGSTFNLKSAFNLQLARGIYQVSKVRADFSGMGLGECPFAFREPWFQGRGIDPVFNAILDTDPDYPIEAHPEELFSPIRLAEDYFPTFNNIYTYEKLELDGGRLIVDFERSATWPREPTTIKARNKIRDDGAFTGTEMASDTRDEYGNRVHFDRVPKYGWHTDYKTPHRNERHHNTDSSFKNVPKGYHPIPNAWRLPHKRLRTVQLFEADDDTATSKPLWTIAFVYEHPASDRIGPNDTPVANNVGDPIDPRQEWKSLYSHLPQAEWDFGRLPELNDETTLLTVQAYKQDVMEQMGPGFKINGHTFRDDLSVWQSTVSTDEETRLDASARAYTGATFYEKPLYPEGDANGDGFPGVPDVDDDGDSYYDEDCMEYEPGDLEYGVGCPDLNENGIPDYIEDDDEDGILPGLAPPRFGDLLPDGHKATDPPGDADGFGCPGLCGIDDDEDGLIDEDSNGYQAYLKPSGTGTCDDCQACFQNNDDFNPNSMPKECTAGGAANGTVGGPSVCHDVNGAPLQTYNGAISQCKNPLYWRYNGTSYTNVKMDPFAVWDDDEDGLIDEDGLDDPLLVDIRSLPDNDPCVDGRHPYVPANATLPSTDSTVWTDDCRPALDGASDPWTHQVQYVYARTNPYWLLAGRNADGSRFYRDKPKYYFFAPFTEPFEDTNGDGVRNGSERFINVNKNEWSNGTPKYDKYVGSDVNNPDLPNVHPDCVPDADFRGPQGITSATAAIATDPIQSVKPSDVHLIKRIVRTREDVTSNPTNFVERVWLYRYSDVGFLKAEFDPASVQALIDADPDDAILQPDDILHYADSYDVAGRPLIMYASQWYTYYNPYVDPIIEDNDTVGADNNIVGIPACYDTPPVVSTCGAGFGFDILDATNPNHRLPINGCDGEILWTSGYRDEMEIDSDCSPLMKQNCGWCYARNACGGDSSCPDPACFCNEGASLNDEDLQQLGIPGAQPRFRKYLIKTARMRGGDGAMHLYRFDYLGGASSVYSDNQRVTSYADPHNITIVDEIVEQDIDETLPWGERNEFYIYEDEFRLNLDPAPAAQRPAGYAGSLYEPTSHYLNIPSKVKSRRVVVMNYYGIAISDRLIVTPGFVGDQTSLVDNQQYELLNRRGQAKHVYDPSWVAGLRVKGANFVRDQGRVLVELFGGTDGWYSALVGIAKGAGGGNIYNQQCKTPEEVMDDVPVQRVAKEKTVVVKMTQHLIRNGEPGDLPSAEANYYKVTMASAVDANVDDPAGTLGNVINGAGCSFPPQDVPCECGVGRCPGNVGDVGCTLSDYLPDIDLHNQDTVTISGLDAIPDKEDDGVSMVRYHYTFHDDEKRQVKWKWRWEEPVTVDNGGSDQVALEMWYHDANGRVRLYGKGAGSPAVFPAHSNPEIPFLVTYTGYDQFGRNDISIEDFELPGNIPGVDLASQPLFDRKYPDTAINLTTTSKYNDFGALKTRRVGYQTQNQANTDATAVTWSQVQRTDFKVIGNNTIGYRSSAGISTLEWQDPFIYQIQYDSVDLAGASVHGTTSVQVLNKAGQLIEQRLIGWNEARADASASGKSMNDMIKDFGWGISLADYDYNNAIEDSPLDLPGDNWINGCQGTGCAGDCVCFVNELLESGTFSPEPNTTSNSGSGYDEVIWPLPAEEQLVTLARSFKQYQQASTLKPTHDIQYSSFSNAPPTDPNSPDRRTAVREYTYDLEERIARQLEPDGSISRFLFDSKRRATKIFRGSADGCPDWFPRNFTTGLDDMVLIEERLYNDGTDACEHTLDPFTNDCRTETLNEDFPNDANSLVRVRKFTDTAEECNANHPEAASRDTQYLYDWRGRQVMTRSLAVGYPTGDTNNPTSSVSDPIVVSATSTVFDNLGRPTIVATWSGDAAPVLSRVEYWQDETNLDLMLGEMIASQPLTLSQTFYDERGRVFEQRTYDPHDMSKKYTFTKTYRDDLNRVVGQLTPDGMTTNIYDALGRVLSTSFWTKESTTQGQGGGLEMTRTETEYNAFGGVTETKFYDRKPGLTGDLPDNAIITYTHNWYNKDNNRLVATANFGTAEDDGYVSAVPPGVPPAYDADTPPTWNGTAYSIPNALITQFDYDPAGRRDWTRDPNGVITKKWFDLLGRTLLVAENWDDPAYANDVHTPPIRYTAKHYTRGGLMDMIVAVLPDNGQALLTPENLGWLEDASNDYAATTVSYEDTAETGDLQVTQFLYGADIVNQSDHAVLASKAPGLVGTVRYPDPTTGQATTADVLAYKYTIDGKVAQRTDQRGVTLDYDYGSINGSQGGCSSCAGGSGEGDNLSRVDVAYPSSNTSPGDVYDGVEHLDFRYDARGQLIAAESHGTSASQPTSAILTSVEFGYDSVGNLTHESLDPTPATSLAKTVNYVWNWMTPTGSPFPTNRLQQMTYPSSTRTLNYAYGSNSSTDPDNLMSRMTGLTSIIDYDLTGSGRTVKKTWGSNKIKLDYTQSGRLDRFGRIATMAYSVAGADIQKFAYEYDANGNRTVEEVDQAGHPNDRSFIYRYDPLNRLQHAGKGTVTTEPGGEKVLSGGTPRVQSWQMDVLGNWSGNGTDSFREYDDVGGDWTFDSTDPAEFVGSFYQNHDSNQANRIGTLEYDTGNGAQSAKFIHDDAGNIIVDRDKYYVYDAWNRLVEAYDKGDGLVDPVTGDFVVDGIPGNPIAKYIYDALGRRIEHVLHDATGAPTQTDRFYYDGKRIIEHHRDGSLHRQYVYGLNYINEPVAYYESAAAGAAPYFILQDANYNVIAVTNASGTLLQQYSYWPYGEYIAIENGSGGPQTESDLLLPFGFQGMFGLHEINAYTAGPRIVSTYSGNWYQRDPNGQGLVIASALARNGQAMYASSLLALTGQFDDGMNPYEYVSSRPTWATDPLGLESWKFDGVTWDSKGRAGKGVLANNAEFREETANPWAAQSLPIVVPSDPPFIRTKAVIQFPTTKWFGVAMVILDAAHQPSVEIRTELTKIETAFKGSALTYDGKPCFCPWVLLQRCKRCISGKQHSDATWGPYAVTTGKIDMLGRSTEFSFRCNCKKPKVPPKSVWSCQVKRDFTCGSTR